jgi:hypothetical protein
MTLRKIFASFPQNKRITSESEWLLILCERGIPNYLLNMISAYAATRDWMPVLTPAGNIAAKVSPDGFSDIQSALVFKEYAAHCVKAHPIVYNNHTVYQNALTYQLPMKTDHTGIKPRINMPAYTVVEVAPNKYDYILSQRTLYVTDNATFTESKGTIYSPYVQNKWASSQTLTNLAHECNDLTGICFYAMAANWVYNTALGVMEFVVDAQINHAGEDDDVEIDWAED